MKTLAPNTGEIINQCKLILQGINFAVNPDIDTAVPPKYNVFPEWIESFDNGNNPDALRSDLDTYSDVVEGVNVTLGRVNSWLIDELSITSSDIPLKSNILNDKQPRKKRVERLLRLFYFYQYKGDGVTYVRRVIDLAREAFNKPALGFSEPKSNFIESVSDLQVPLISEGDFNGIIAYIRGCQLRVTTIEPR
ncbi:MAG: hypothetical protein KG003_03175 [Bacteroidetes bacterium]|nr:hypothetical protein [Bacteroidota bacterium]